VKERDYAVLSALGSDRVGIVDDITAILTERRCNVEESRMAILGGDFAVIMLVSGERGAINSLLPEFPKIGERLGLRLEGRRTAAPRSEGGLPYVIESVSLDTPGIVHSISALLRRENINIVDLETATVPAPLTGAPMFLMKLRIALPSGIRIASLKREVERLAEEQDLDIKLYPATTGKSE
jgi:glycine cleavage system transcriptional repressor